MTGKVFENPKDRQITMVQVWLVGQDFPSNILVKELLFLPSFSLAFLTKPFSLVLMGYA